MDQMLRLKCKELSDWVSKTQLCETHLKYKDIGMSTVKGWNKIEHTNIKQNKDSVAIYNKVNI